MPPNPLINGACTVSGFSQPALGEHVEQWARAPFPVPVRLEIDGEILESANFVLEEQRYDFSCGELHTHGRVRTRGGLVRLEVVTFCSRSLPTLVAQEIRLATEGRVEAVVRTIPSPDVPRGFVNELALNGVSGSRFIDAAYEFRIEGGTSLGLAAVSASPAKTGEGYHSGPVERGHPLVVHQFVSLLSSLMHSQPALQAARMASLGASRGFERLRQENRACWKEIWRGRVVVNAQDPKWQAIADACYFYTHTSAHQASPNATGLFGLGWWTDYHYFNGHTFWDLDTFVVPPLALTAPGSAAALLDYRFRGMEAARRNAAMNGYRGLQFPWEGSTKGEEALPLGWSHILHEQHITPDVAIAFATYARATADPVFLRERAWPILHGVAEWIESRVEKTARGYEIRGVIGIDEGSGPVDNNSWTNAACAVALREAQWCAATLGYPVANSWNRVASQMAMPIDPFTGALVKFDGWQPKEGEATCPDPAMVVFPLGFELMPTAEKMTLKYNLQWGRAAVGWPMHSAFHGVWAARIGERELAAERFEAGVADYMFGPYMQIDEFSRQMTQSKPKVGPYLAHAGGFLMGLLLGLPGISLRHQGWTERTAGLPAGWESVEVERIILGGHGYRMRARHGAVAELD
jgi:trehalose/maltose hydrolase-like predicted phosphorylase